MYDFYCMEPAFFDKWHDRKSEAQLNDSIINKIYEMKADDLDAQYKRVFQPDGKTARIRIYGPLSPDGPDALDVYFGFGGTAYKNIIRAVDEAKTGIENGVYENVEILINSPGGTLEMVAETFEKIKEIKENAVVINTGLIASAAMWLACGVKKIKPQNETVSAGSIGVVVTVYDDSEAMAGFGVKKYVITNTQSPNKIADVSENEGRALIQKRLNDFYDVFATTVAANRPLTREAIDGLKGEVLIAEKAVEVGLMDGEKPKEKEYKKMEGKTMENETIEMVDEAVELKTEPAVDLDAEIKAERKRIYELLIVSGVDLDASVKTAVEVGTSVGDFAVKLQESKKEKALAEIENAKAVRIEAVKKDDPVKIENDEPFNAGVDKEKTIDERTHEDVKAVLNEMEVF
jgi:ClpP class serine protease